MEDRDRWYLPPKQNEKCIHMQTPKEMLKDYLRMLKEERMKIEEDLETVKVKIRETERQIRNLRKRNKKGVN